MAKIAANTAGLQQANHDYNFAPLGKLGARSVELNGVPHQYRSSSSRSSVKSLFSRVADKLPGNNGKVRSYNRNQKELGRQIGNLLGNVYSNGKRGAIGSLVSDLSELGRLTDKMDSKVQGYDKKGAVDAQLDVALGKLEQKQLRSLYDNMKQQTIDLTANGDPNELAAADALRKQISDAVEKHFINGVVQKYGTGVPEVRYLLQNCKGKAMYEWSETKIPLPQLDEFLKANFSPEDASRIHQGGKTLKDYGALVLPSIGMTHEQAVDSLKHGCDLAEVGKLRLANLGPGDAILFATNGVKAADKRLLESKGLSKEEILAFKSAGWSSNGVNLDAFQHSAVTNRSSTKGGNVNDVYKVDVNRGSGPETMYFAKAQSLVPEGGISIMEALNPDWSRFENGHLSERNVASYQLDQELGFDQVPETGFASIRLPDGSIAVGTAMGAAPGKACTDTGYQVLDNWIAAGPGDLHSIMDAGVRELNPQLSANGLILRHNNTTHELEIGDLQPPDQTGKVSGDNWRKADDHYRKQVDTAGFPIVQERLRGDGVELRVGANGAMEKAMMEALTHDIPIDDAGLREQSFMMQYSDALEGQGDRSQANYFVHRRPDGTVELKKIDNDMSFGTYPNDLNSIQKMSEGTGQLKCVGLPPLASPKIIAAFNKMTDAHIDRMYTGRLSPDQITAAKGRLAGIKQHLKSLPPDQIIGDKEWGGQKATDLINQHCTKTNSYLIRDAEYFSPAA